MASKDDEERDKRRERDRGTTSDADLHNMGGDVGPASIRGSNVSPGSKPRDDAEPESGYAEPMGYVTGRDDEWSATAGSDEKAVAARTDEIDDHVATYGPSPHPMPPQEREQRGEPGDPGFRVQGPVDEDEHGLIVDEDDEPGASGEAMRGGEHINANADWVPSDEEDDPDGGSGRTGSGDGGYLPGEGTGRPYG
ncbi:hypothetical protein FE391_10375 [Nonomuraea sp. KC401]|uniref:hypothetical protein n=1 Tax=unclassified Nonomuraea TaxID=2593643 RepID=UPI0010FE35D9|nr:MULTISPECIES: hypothetical protein [unclassified Nonomuraea]NBE93276.1 hypothetical protein [Nonomuraea sp. K271]TLF77988.1 hypothetical protein FE391_10375 [Nonomuraea sp. KC401]